MVFEIDELGKEIIKYLCEDPRGSYRTIASKVDAPESTVRYRLNKILEDRIVTPIVAIDPNQVGYPYFASIKVKLRAILFRKDRDKLFGRIAQSMIDNFRCALVADNGEDILYAVIFSKTKEDLKYVKDILEQSGNVEDVEITFLKRKHISNLTMNASDIL